MAHSHRRRWLTAGCTAIAVTALGLSGASAVAADDSLTSSAAPRTASAEMSAAMQRDLGLTAGQAAARLAAEERASAVERTVAAKLGAAFGGAWYDEHRGRLVVATTDAATVRQVRDLGADAVVVDRTAAELDAAKQRIDALAGHAAPAAVTSWYADAASNSVVVTVDPSRSDAAAESFVATAAALDGVRIVHSVEAPQPAYNVVGGSAFHIGNSRCSIGFSARTAGGAKAFVTAGHCTAGGGAVSGANGVRMGSASGSTFGGGGDYGKVSVTRADWRLRPWVNLYDGRALVVNGSQVASVGQSVCRSGSTSGWRCGTIKAKNVTVNYPGRTVHGLVRSSACAAPGDSGGPFMHNGQGQGMTSGITAQCGSGGVTDSFYQPLREALNAYNLRLVTG